MKITESETLPKTEGWYFLKLKTSSVWEVLVNVVGWYPFFQYRQIINLADPHFNVPADVNLITFSEKLELI